MGHRLERAANMIIINVLPITNIHILTSLTYNSADLQACYLANIIIIHNIIVQLDSYSDTHHEMSSLLVVVKSHLFPQFVRLN